MILSPRNCSSLLNRLSQLQDYNTAASYCRQLAPFYANAGWSDLEISMLDTYADCLKKLHREEEHVRISLKILAKIDRGSSTFVRQSSTSVTGLQNPIQILRKGAHNLSTILATSKCLNVEVSTSLNNYFSNVHLDKYIQHFLEQDGFKMHLNVESLSSDELPFQSVQVRLVSAEADQHSEIWLSAKDQLIKPGKTRILLSSRVRPHRIIYK